MKNKLSIVLILLLVLCAAEKSYSVGGPQGTTKGKFFKVGAAGAQFLKIGVGANGTAMGDAYSSLASDLSALYWNPAGIADIKEISAHFSYTDWFANYGHNFAAVSAPISDDFIIAAHIISFGVDNIEVTNFDNTDGTGTYYSINDFVIGGSIGGYLTDRFSFGVTGKYISNNFTDLDAAGYAFDIGTMYETGIQGIKLGFAIMNLGGQMQYEGQDLNSTKKIHDQLYASSLDVQFLTSPYNLPLIFRAGMSTELIYTGDHKLVGAFDFVTHSDIKEQFCFGLDYTWYDLLSVRAGYKLGHDQLNFAGGIGVNYLFANMIPATFDFSAAPSLDLGLVYRLSINLGVK